MRPRGWMQGVLFRPHKDEEKTSSPFFIRNLHCSNNLDGVFMGCLCVRELARLAKDRASAPTQGSSQGCETRGLLGWIQR